MGKIQRILVPIDGSEHALHAVEQAADLAEGRSVTLLFLYVTDIHKVAVDSYLLDEILASHQRLGESVLKSAMEKVPEGMRAETYIKEGNPKDVIVDFATAAEADMIVMGTRGLGAIKGALLGSVSQYVIQNAACSVLVCK